MASEKVEQPQHIITDPFHLTNVPSLEESKKGLTIIHPFYNDNERLSYHIENWKTWPDRLLDKITIIIVDDHSDQPIHKEFIARRGEVPNLNINIYRIKDNLRFNTPGAINLGVEAAPSPYFVFMDSDCMLERPMIEKLMTLRPDPCFHYWFPRKRITNVEGPAKYNTRYLPCAILTNRNVWDIVGGMDEDFTGEWSGGYGFFDNYLQWKLFQHRLASGLLQDVPITEYLEDIVGPNVQQRENVKRHVHLKTNKNIMYQKQRGEFETNPARLRFRWKKVI